jgi:hypothetical protein
MAYDQSRDSKSIEAGVPKEGRINLENIIMLPQLKPTESKATSSSAKPANGDLGIRSTRSSRVLRSSSLPASSLQRHTSFTGPEGNRSRVFFILNEGDIKDKPPNVTRQPTLLLPCPL